MVREIKPQQPTSLLDKYTPLPWRCNRLLQKKLLKVGGRSPKDTLAYSGFCHKLDRTGYPTRFAVESSSTEATAD